MKARPATRADAEGMSAVLAPIIRMWNSDRASDPDHIRARYIDDPKRIACTVIDHDGLILGFQSLQRAGADNPYGVTPGWGVIGTYVALDQGRRGMGALLFDQSLKAAQDAGLEWIDATIGKDNPRGLGYYRKLGFVPYRDAGSALAHRFRVPGA